MKFLNAVKGSPSTGQFVSVDNPYSGEQVGQAELSDWQNVDSALSQAHAIFRDKKCWLSVPKRIDIEKTVFRFAPISVQKIIP